MKTRRYFWGNTLPQALMAAARYHGLPPDELAYRVHDKRHGFVTRTRRLIIAVDPAAPQRAPGALRETPPKAAPPPPAAARLPRPTTAPQVPVVASSGASERPAVAARPAAGTRPAAGAQPAAGTQPAAGAPRPRSAGSPAGAGPVPEPFLPPDEESELAASVALGRLLTFAALDLAVQVERQPERLLLALSGPDESRLGELGEEFLDDLEHLVPRVIRGLTGRMVRCKVDGAGLRVAREEELRKLAERTAGQVATTGEAVLLEPLASADRRIVHLALVDDPRVRTESQGYGAEKRVLISPAGNS